MNPGREGIAFSKLSKQAEGIENLLCSIAEDIGLPADQNQWLAKEFKNGSVYSTAEHQALVNAETLDLFNAAVRNLIRFKPTADGTLPHGISLQTLESFANLRTPLEVDETIGIGLYDQGTKAPKFYKVTKLRLEDVAKAIDAETSYIGAIIGYTYEWTKGAKEPFIKIRDIASGDLVKCCYDDADYKKVAKLFDKKDALVIVSGHITFNRLSKKSEITKATDFEIAPDLSQDQYDSFFGCAPDLTNGVDAASYIRKIRGDE